MTKSDRFSQFCAKISRKTRHGTEQDCPLVAFHGLGECHPWIKNASISPDQHQKNHFRCMMKSAKFHRYCAKLARSHDTASTRITQLWLSMVLGSVTVEFGMPQLVQINIGTINFGASWKVSNFTVFTQFERKAMTRHRARSPHCGFPHSLGVSQLNRECLN